MIKKTLFSKIIIGLILFSIVGEIMAQVSKIKPLNITQYSIREEIAPKMTRLTSKAIRHAINNNSDLLIIDMSTYGGLVNDADSISSALLNCPVPVWVFINNNAASAGALIAIACDSIYMKSGSRIGAATVVTQTGDAAPDKYQSYMRGIIKSVAEAQGGDTINGAVIYRRNPEIAEAMVDDRIYLKNITDSGKVITFTVNEAIEHGYCEAKVNSIEAMLHRNGIEKYIIKKIEPNTLDKFMGWLMNPAVRGVLIMLIIGGLYFELQTPGIGFPILASITAAVLYFAPSYLDGLVENWELAIFFIGLILLVLEFFIIPGFGIAGIGGIFLIMSSLILALIRNVNFDFTVQNPGTISTSVVTVLLAMMLFVGVAFMFGSVLYKSKLLTKVALTHDLANVKVNKIEKGDTMIGKDAEVFKELKPQGKIMYNNKLYDAKSYGKQLTKGTKVKIIDKAGLVCLVVEK